MNLEDTICASASGNGGAISIIRISGKETFICIDKILKLKSGVCISECLHGTHHFGIIEIEDRIIDEVVVNVYHNPKSYTGEDLIEVFCHGSSYIQQEIISAILSNGIRLATPGEFTTRAFMNGKMDLSQAEAVADLISTHNKASHRLAIEQMRGGFSSELSKLREKLIKFISLVELELDFAEEDVEFADRSQLKELVNKLLEKTTSLRDSFRTGNAIKNGIPVAIAGRTNVGKSTLLNAILNEDRAIVSEIHGTTRDSIEDLISINGTGFRFIDTAGIRTTADKIESLGIERTYSKIKQANIILLLVNSYDTIDEVRLQLKEIRKELATHQKLFLLINKTDIQAPKFKIEKSLADKIIEISAREKRNIEELIKALIEVSLETEISAGEVVVTNVRHFEALKKAAEALERVKKGLETELPGDLLSSDIRLVMTHIGEITGEILNQDVLNKIFSDFCIGK